MPLDRKQQPHCSVANPPAIEPFLPITDLAPHSTPLTGLPKLKRTLQFSWAILSNLLSFVPVLDWFAYPKAKAVSLLALDVDLTGRP